ncbi:MAG: hypothetical protein WAV67_14935, partial [Dokdonella sp.]
MIGILTPMVLVLLVTLLPLRATAVTVSVGSVAGCTYSTLQAALTALSGQGGSHAIRMRTQTFASPDGVSYLPDVTQSTVTIEGGYANCSDTAPTIGQSSTLDASGGLPRSALRLFLDGRVASLQIRRLTIRGGDATDDATFNGDGGGLSIRGPAVVTLGSGASISNNSAVRGGGIALQGGRLIDAVAAKVDLIIDEGASVSNNTATEDGGGIYCGYRASISSSGYRHGSIIGRDGLIANNTAGGQGAAFNCFGTVEGGGGLRPLPRNGAALIILGNVALPSGVCAGGFGTLDTSVAKNAEGYRPLGAADGETGLLALVNNEGPSPGLCLFASTRQSNGSVPFDESVFQLQNLLVSGQLGPRGALGLLLNSQALRLRIRPSGRSVACSFFSPTPCVSFDNNQAEGTPGSGDPSYVIQNLGDLELIRASIRSNLSRPAVINSYIRSLRLESSVIDNNVVQLAGSSSGTVRSAIVVGWGLANFSGQASIVQSTVRFTTPLDRFFTMDQASSAVTARASIFTSTAMPAPDTRGGAAAASNFRREWCGYFQQTFDFASHTVVPDPTTGTFQTISPSVMPLAAGSLVPNNALV